ncbi:hypothetical protein HZC30_06005 [Candidatus Woesearchaeota archaeon]|nr:hypothetical protein [Candidatus Woesearchaeota archaeon]
MIELNFGQSEYFNYSPDIGPDMIVRIPEKGKLEDLSDSILGELLDFESAKARVSSITSKGSGSAFTTVEFPLKCDYAKDWCVEHKIILPWIAERGEWVAIAYRKWVESGARNDEHYSGPFRPNEYCARKIVQAHGRLESGINIETMLITSPERLKQISRSPGLAYSVLYSVEGDDDAYAVDWDWQIKGKWAHSCREYGLGHAWQNEGPLNEPRHDSGKQAYRALLESFGLESRADEFSIDKIVAMSPAELAKAGGKDPESGTLGDHRKASEVR